MRKIKLWARSGGFVVEVEIPDFLKGQNPDAIQWGSRVFFKTMVSDKEEYREGILYVVQEEKQK